MRIVYAWELGGGRGHLGAALPVLRCLRALGHEIWICCPEDLFEAVDMPEFASSWRRAPKRFLAPVSGTLPGHAEILATSGGFYDEGNLLVLLRNWRELLTELRTDIVIGDFAPAAMLAARSLGLTRIVFDTGFFYPPDDAAFPVLDAGSREARGRLRSAESDLIRIVNVCLEKLGAPPVSDIRSLFRADDVLLVNHASLDCFGRGAAHQFVGPVFDNGDAESATQPLPAGFADGDAECIRVFAYLSPHYHALEEVLDALADNPRFHSVVYLPGSDAWEDPGRWSGPKLSLISSPANMMHALAAVDVVICHGGVGTINQALFHNVPLALLPMFREQELNASKIQALGLGGWARGRVGGTLAPLLERLASDRGVAKRVASFSQKHQPANVESLAKRIEHCHEQARRNRASPTHDVHAKSSGKKVCFADLDVVFISFDEPNADENWARLLVNAPHARRVHGVKGFERAHREASRLARTARFVTVDADTVVEPGFFATCVEIPAEAAYSTWCWSSVNAVNGLAYGNGGVKIWSRDHLEWLCSHESEIAAFGLSYDFCFHAGYSQYSRSFATTFPNGSPLQAFRAGFREAVKLGRDKHGKVVPVEVLNKGMRNVNIRRLIVWMSIGADARHGLWSVLGARMAFMKNREASFDPAMISSFNWFQSLWQEARQGVISEPDVADADRCAALQQAVLTMGEEIRRRYGLSHLSEWSSDRSRKFKESMMARRPRRGVFDMAQDL